MFGSDYYNYPEILIDSFGKMKDDYEKKAKKVEKSSLLNTFIKIYIRMFGIPEIGFQVRYMHCSKILSEYIIKSPKKVLDAGSGIGSYTFFLHKKYPKASIIGGEIDKNKLTFSRNYLKTMPTKKVTFTYMDIIRKNTPKNSYDLIVNIDVLEHIKNYKKVLSNFSKLLRPGGYLYIHTPHQNQKRIFSFSKNWHHGDHVREGFVKDVLIRDVVQSGLEIVSVHVTFGPFARFAWEINHLFLDKSFILAGLTYPLLYLISCLDLITSDTSGWGIALLAREPKKTHYGKK